MSWSDYKLIKKIGEGAFGKAWLVQANKKPESFVIKEINMGRVSAIGGECLNETGSKITICIVKM